MCAPISVRDSGDSGRRRHRAAGLARYRYAQAQRLIPRLARRLFGLSLFYKALIANSALVVLGALAARRSPCASLHCARLARLASICR